MDEQLFRQVMKEWYWLVIFASLIAVAFAPSFLKAKCPQCGKRKLTSVAVDDPVRISLEVQTTRQFLTFYRCDGCKSKLFRERSGRLEDAESAGLRKAFEQEELEAIMVAAGGSGRSSM